MTLRAIGPTNGTLPQATGVVVSYITDPDRYPFNRYAQMIEAPDVPFSYITLDVDDPSRLVSINEFNWPYDDYRPTGKGFTIRAELTPEVIQRWDFPYTLGDQTRKSWLQGQNLDPKQMHEQYRLNHAMLHRATRIVGGLSTASFPANNTATPDELLGTTGAYFDLSSGQQYLVTSSTEAANPNFQVIKKTFQRVKRRLNLITNGVITGDEIVAVLPPKVADAIAASGEMMEYLKGSPFAKELTDPNIRDWNLPPYYAGFKLVVEDTVRCFINQKANGVVADVSVSSEKDYILDDDTIYFVSRAGGLKGNFGGRNFSTVQVYTLNGPAQVQAFSEPKHTLTEGHIVLEDKVVFPSLISGFKLTDVLSPDYE